MLMSGTASARTLMVTVATTTGHSTSWFSHNDLTIQWVCGSCPLPVRASRDDTGLTVQQA